MNELNIAQMRDIADDLTCISGIMEYSSEQLKALQIRKAEKSLISLENFFTSDLIIKLQKWRDASKALQVLQIKLVEVEKKRALHFECLEKIVNLEKAFQNWLNQKEEDRIRILNQGKIAKQYIEQKTFDKEANILHKYERYRQLQGLISYADNVEYLCDAIFHYENQDKYANNIEKLKIKKNSAKERFKSVERGFYISLFFCFFIITLIITLPFCFNLLARKKEIETQIANINEMIKREEKRLEIAAEGIIANKTIKEITGEISLEQIRLLLHEVRELRLEFHNSSKHKSYSSNLLTFIELYKVNLVNLFGEFPSKPFDAINFFAQQIEEVQKTEDNINELQTEAKQIKEAEKAITKGYSYEVLKQSIINLENTKNKSITIIADDEIKELFTEISLKIPNILSSIREALWYISHGQNIEPNYWREISTNTKSIANLLSSCVLSMEIDDIYGTNIDNDEETIKLMIEIERKKSNIA